MYLGGFYQFPKFRQNRPTDARFLAKKGHFCRNSVTQLKNKFFGRKFMRFQGNGPIGLKIGIHVPQGPCQRHRESFLDILSFGYFIGPDMCRGGLFWSILNEIKVSLFCYIVIPISSNDHHFRQHNVIIQAFNILKTKQKMT